MAHEAKAEEILRKHCPGFDPILMNFTARDFKDKVLMAMFEYANYMIDLNKDHLLNQAIDDCIDNLYYVDYGHSETLWEIVKQRLESLKIKP